MGLMSCWTLILPHEWEGPDGPEGSHNQGGWGKRELCVLGGTMEGE